MKGIHYSISICRGMSARLGVQREWSLVGQSPHAMDATLLCKWAAAVPMRGCWISESNFWCVRYVPFQHLPWPAPASRSRRIPVGRPSEGIVTNNVQPSLTSIGGGNTLSTALTDLRDFHSPQSPWPGHIFSSVSPGLPFCCLSSSSAPPRHMRLFSQLVPERYIREAFGC
jgi:hypothetical protein